ncbi:MAG: response regulator transcription factor [Chloroflexota bacterium]|nr:response regulator transcription factor [Chloroflexota bacterium]
MTLQALVVSPYPTVRAGLRAILVAGEISVAWEAEGVMGLRQPWPLQPDVALVDWTAGGAAVEALAQQAPELGIVVLGDDRPRYSPEWGSTARGYLTRDAPPEDILAAVRTVAQGLAVLEPSLVRSIATSAPAPHAEPRELGEESLSPRELEVLQLLAAGLPNKTIAVQLNISEHTAKFHVSSVLAKLGAASRTEAVTLAARRGLLLL